VHNEPLGSLTDIVERIASHQRQSWLRCGIQHIHPVWVNDASGIYLILEDAVVGLNDDHIIFPDVPQTTEERIAMCGETNISRLSRQSGARYMSNSALQSPLVNSLLDHSLHVHPRDLNTGFPLAIEWNGLEPTLRDVR
jgi:hypothetical protein